MKKFLTLFLSICLTFPLFTGCAMKKEKKAIALAESIYNELISANEYCETIEKAVYGAWYFAVYEADNYNYERILVYYTERTGVPGDVFIEAAESHGVDVLTLLFSLSDINITVPCTITALKINNTIPNLNKNLKTAKEDLEKMEEKFSKFEHFSDLKSLYTKIKTYSQKLINPDNGLTLNQLEDIIDTYKKDIKELISDLDFLVNLD